MTIHENMAYWVWLQRAVGKGANLERLLSPYHGDIRAFCEADPGERDAVLRKTPHEYDYWPSGDLRSMGGRPDTGRSPGKPRKPRPIAEGTLARLRRVPMAEVGEVLETCEREGIVPLCPEDECYPPLLREVPSRPAVLYALGDVSVLNGELLPLAMVGARDARLTSLCAASTLAGTLAKAGFLVVSGAAIGTDAACHIGALNAGCPTVAVLGTGIGTRYLQQNADLRRVISKNGVLLSEMEPGEPGSKGSFPLRNRIIAGMSVGTVVVEAAIKSGSLITSKYAEEFDRDVFVPRFPGVDPEKPLAPGTPNTAFRGTKELLERETGRGVTCPMDVLVEFIAPYDIDLWEVLRRDGVEPEDLLRDITDPAGQFPPLLSQPMVLRARAQLGRDASGRPVDLAGAGTLNADPGWGPYRTREDAEHKVYTAAEFAYRRGDHPHDRPPEPTPDSPADSTRRLVVGNPSGLPVETLADFPALSHGDDAREELLPAEPQLPAWTDEEREAHIAGLDGEALRVARAFQRTPGHALYYDQLDHLLDMAPQYLLAALTELQIKGLIDILPDTRYRMR